MTVELVSSPYPPGVSPPPAGEIELPADLMERVAKIQERMAQPEPAAWRLANVDLFNTFSAPGIAPSEVRVGLIVSNECPRLDDALVRANDDAQPFVLQQLLKASAEIAASDLFAESRRLERDSTEALDNLQAAEAAAPEAEQAIEAALAGGEDPRPYEEQLRKALDEKRIYQKRFDALMKLQREHDKKAQPLMRQQMEAVRRRLRAEALQELGEESAAITTFLQEHLPRLLFARRRIMLLGGAPEARPSVPGEADGKIRELLGLYLAPPPVYLS